MKSFFLKKLCFALFTLVLLSGAVHHHHNHDHTKKAPNSESVLGMRKAHNLETVTVKEIDQTLVTSFPKNSCLKFTATPLVIRGFLVFVANKNFDDDECAQKYVQTGLYAASTKTGKIYSLISHSGGSATASYHQGLIIQPQDSAKQGIAWWSRGNFRIVQPSYWESDTSGLALGQKVLIGNRFSSLNKCLHMNEPANECHSIIKVGPDGIITKSLGEKNGFLVSVTASPSTDGEFYYIGTGKSPKTNENYPNDCSILKLNSNLEIAASYQSDPEDCVQIGDWSSEPVGEIVVTQQSLWVQYRIARERKTQHSKIKKTNSKNSASRIGPHGRPLPFGLTWKNDSSDLKKWNPQTQEEIHTVGRIVRLNKNTLAKICEANFPTNQTKAASQLHHAPVIDQNGYAYAVFRNTENKMNSSLFQISPSCQSKRLYDFNTDFTSSPTLVKNHVAIAARDELHLIPIHPPLPIQSYRLGSQSKISAGVVTHKNGISVLHQDGTLTTLKQVPYKDYANNVWPRLRRDNFGTASSEIKKAPKTKSRKSRKRRRK